MIRCRLTLALASLVLAACSGGSSGAHTPLSERYPIDGHFDLVQFTGVQQQQLDFRDAFGTGNIVKSTTARWVVESDDRDFYFAIEWTDDTLNSFDPNVSVDDFDGILLAFDNDHNGVLDENEDARRLLMTDFGSIYSDVHADSVPQADADVTGDGLGRMTYAAGTQTYQAEFLIPRTADGAGEDGLLGATTRWKFDLFDHVQFLLPRPSGNETSLAGAPGAEVGHDASAWPLLPDTASGSYAHPAFPAHLGGLIAFISDHENPLGDIYTFDPATGAITRVTNSALFKDCVSLSHDRTRIAFHGAPSATDLANYEIYRVDVSGANLVQLTNDAPILSGHPGWSPDDSEIVYASFLGGGIASLVRIDATDGTQLAILSPPGANENDPDWTPDGRIVFKTDRWSTYPELRIGVMDADGTNVVQLTSLSGTSDHDPTAIAGTCVFERFMSATDYSTDPFALYSSWNIVEAQLDGSSEHTLVSDGWVNWLPVHDPSGKYIAHLKTVGYTDLRLMTRDGRDLGRLLPDQTQIRYFDWK